MKRFNLAIFCDFVREVLIVRKETSKQCDRFGGSKFFRSTAGPSYSSAAVSVAHPLAIDGWLQGVKGNGGFGTGERPKR